METSRPPDPAGPRGPRNPRGAPPNMTQVSRSHPPRKGTSARALSPPQPGHGVILPLALIASSFFHMAGLALFMFHPVVRQKAATPEPMLVRLIELPSGRGGATEGTPGKTAETAPPKEPEPVRIEKPKTTLPGKEPPKPKEGPSPVNTDKPGVAAGLGRGGKAGLGGKGEGILLDDATFEYEWYRARLEDALKSNWRKPVLETPKTIAASVHFVITLSGQAEGIQLVQSSGNALFDQSVLRAVYDSQPFPKFPPQYSLPKLGVLYTFELLPEGADAQPWEPPVKKKAKKR